MKYFNEMLNRIVIINSELYAKAAIFLGDTNSIQLVAESNVGKSSFLNTLNFLYITDKDRMYFEGNRTLSDSMKHYFEDSSTSYILFETFNNGYYCILVKATYEKAIEYYKINGEYQENYFIETTKDGFKPKKWEKVVQDITIANPTDVPQKLSNEELYNLIYNSDNRKSPVVLINNNKVKRKGKSLSNSFTDIYKHLIKTSEITEKSFKNSLLVADSRQDTKLDVFSSSSSDKIEKLESKKAHLDCLKEVKDDFEHLKTLNDKFISLESVLGKLKNTFFKQYDKIALKLSNEIDENSPLSQEIRELNTKIEVTLKKERDELIGKKTTETNNCNSKKVEIKEINRKLKEIENYEPTDNNLMYQGLLTERNNIDHERKIFEAQLTQSEQSPFTAKQVEWQIQQIEGEIKKTKNSIKEYDNLLYQNISDNPEISKQIYSYLSSDVSNLDKSKITKKITRVDFPMIIFDGKIDVSNIDIKQKPTIDELKSEVELKNNELSEKKKLLEAITNRENLQKQVNAKRSELSSKNAFIDNIKNKPKLLLQKTDIEKEINVLEETTIPNIAKQIEEKDEKIKRTEQEYNQKTDEKKQLSDKLSQYKQHCSDLQAKDDIYEIEEIVDIPFENLYPEFLKNYRTFAGETGIRANRKSLKDKIAGKLNTDTQDIKQFIREVEEEFNNIAESENIINVLLDSLSLEIGNPTANFLTYFDNFKTFVYHNYNSKLAEYPISNIQSVKVIIDENTDLINDLKTISNLKFSDGLDFDNTYLESKKALEKLLSEQKGKPIYIEDLFSINVELTKNGKTEKIDLAKQVQSNGTDVVLKLYLFLNILKDLLQQAIDNKIVIYIDEIGRIGRKNLKNLILFCEKHNFVPIFATIRNVEGAQKYYIIKEQYPKITFGENQANIVIYENAE
jgi:hypothetical protein